MGFNINKDTKSDEEALNDELEKLEDNKKFIETCKEKGLISQLQLPSIDVLLHNLHLNDDYFECINKNGIAIWKVDLTIGSFLDYRYIQYTYDIPKNSYDIIYYNGPRLVETNKINLGSTKHISIEKSLELRHITKDDELKRKVLNGFPILKNFLEVDDAYGRTLAESSYRNFINSALVLLSDALDLGIEPNMTALRDYMYTNKLDQSHYTKIIQNRALWKYAINKDQSIWYYYNLKTGIKSIKLMIVDRTILHTFRGIQFTNLFSREALQMRGLK